MGHETAPNTMYVSYLRRISKTLSILEPKEALKAFYADIHSKFINSTSDQELIDKAEIDKDFFEDYIEKLPF